LLARPGGRQVSLHDGGCVAVTQGPRLETAAEIRKYAADGNTLVGMTTMPEAALAREAGLDYASLCVIANPAAGISDQPITMEDIHAVLEQAMRQVGRLLAEFPPA
jgi:5'-methylthioinosine phosphorylase